MALTRITQGVIKPNENYDTHNINSTGIVTATALNISGDASIGGVLTYEDVTNVDSVGLLTARSGIRIGGHILPTVNEAYDLGSADKKIRHLFLSDNSLKFVDSSDTEHPLSVDSGRLKFAGGMLLGSDIQLDPISGIITATSFVKGDGSPVGGVVSDSASNTVGGTDAGGASGPDPNYASYNSFFGALSGNSIGNGDANTCIGYKSGEYISSGQYNTSVGFQSLYRVTLGDKNTAIGNNSLKFLGGSASENVAIGHDAAGVMSGGHQNVAIGALALGNSSGNAIGNVAIGYDALKKGGTTTCNYNVAIGYKVKQIEGDNNAIAVTSGMVAIGKSAAYMIKNATNSVFIGDAAGATMTISPGGSFSNSVNTNCIVIGANANPSDNQTNNEITIGDSNITKFRIPGLSINIDSNGISDNKGNLRSLPQNDTTGTYTLVAADAGKHVRATGQITIPSGTFSTGDMITIYNNSASTITIVQDSGTTVYNSNDASTGNKSLKARGLCTILCESNNAFVVSGNFA